MGRGSARNRPGVYVVSLSDELDSRTQALETCAISTPTLQEWLDVRPELRLDGVRPTVVDLSRRLSAFWLSDEVVVYVGLAGTSLRARVRQFYGTPIGARRPHSGGYFIKTLANLDEVYVHWATTDDPATAEDELLRTFCNAISSRTRSRLLDPDHPFPFANLEWPKGARKRHGLSGVRGDIDREVASTTPTSSSNRPSGQVTLHEEIARILRVGRNQWMGTAEIASDVNRAGNYTKRDGSSVTAFQIHGRTKNYPDLFERDGARVRLRP